MRCRALMNNGHCWALGAALFLSASSQALAKDIGDFAGTWSMKCIAGTWSMQCADLEVPVTSADTEIRMRYDGHTGGNGVLVGSFSGNRFEGRWIWFGEATAHGCSSVMEGSNQWGDVAIEFSPDGETFSGNWQMCDSFVSYGGGPARGQWLGARVSRVDPDDDSEDLAVNELPTPDVTAREPLDRLIDDKIAALDLALIDARITETDEAISAMEQEFTALRKLKTALSVDAERTPAEVKAAIRVGAPKTMGDLLMERAELVEAADGLKAVAPETTVPALNATIVAWIEETVSLRLARDLMERPGATPAGDVPLTDRAHALVSADRKQNVAPETDGCTISSAWQQAKSGIGPATDDADRKASFAFRLWPQATTERQLTDEQWEFVSDRKIPDPVAFGEWIFVPEAGARTGLRGRLARRRAPLLEYELEEDDVIIDRRIPKEFEILDEAADAKHSGMESAADIDLLDYAAELMGADMPLVAPGDERCAIDTLGGLCVARRSESGLGKVHCVLPVRSK